jgi:hypothetical protein
VRIDLSRNFGTTQLAPAGTPNKAAGKLRKDQDVIGGGPE